MHAFLDATGAVIGTSSTAYTLSEAQALNGDITTVVVNAPTSLMVKGAETVINPYHHRLVSGDGSLLEHYEEVEVLKPLKVFRAEQIDFRTEELIAEGFEGSTGKRFRIDDGSLTRYNVMYLTRNAGSSVYPKVINVFSNDAVQNLPTVAAVEQFCTEVFLGHQAIVDSGTALKVQIIAATTIAEIDAVVDNR
jgi:hypothetical protein